MNTDSRQLRACFWGVAALLASGITACDDECFDDEWCAGEIPINQPSDPAPSPPSVDTPAPPPPPPSSVECHCSNGSVVDDCSLCPQETIQVDGTPIPPDGAGDTTPQPPQTGDQGGGGGPLVPYNNQVDIPCLLDELKCMSCDQDFQLCVAPYQVAYFNCYNDQTIADPTTTCAPIGQTAREQCIPDYVLCMTPPRGITTGVGHFVN